MRMLPGTPGREAWSSRLYHPTPMGTFDESTFVPLTEFIRDQIEKMSVSVRKQPLINKLQNCIVCNAEPTPSKELTHLFVKNEVTAAPLASTLSAILNKTIDQDTIHSSYICKNCRKLCNEYEEMQNRLASIKKAISHDFNETAKLLEPTTSRTAQPDFNDVENILPEENIDEQEELIISDTLKGQPKIVSVKHVISIRNQGNYIVNVDGSGEDLLQQNITQEYFDESDGNMVEISTEMDADELSEIFEDHVYSDENSSLHYQNSISDLSQDVKDVGKILIGTETLDSHLTNDVTLKPIFMREGSKFKCYLCTDNDMVFDVRTIATHLKTDHDEKVYICDVCGHDFRKRSELSSHLVEHAPTANNGEEYQCDECPKKFANLRLFRIHRRGHYTVQKLWECQECNKKYSSRNLLEEHMNMHTGERPYKCSTCSKDFASKYTLTAHMKIHSERRRPFDCDQCSKSFFSQQNLTQHQRTHTGIKEFVCDVCDKAFGTAHNLDVHRIVHTGYKPFICRTCNKAFARRAEIKDHERTHTGERPYVCEICNASFAQRSNLMSHKRATHLNDKRHKCDICERSFKRKRLLDYHVKAQHTGERPYTCETCDSTFVYPEHYKKHLRIHTGDKPYHCEVCGKAFNSRDNRNAHRFVHSTKKPYECLVCGQGFMRKPLLLAHMTSMNHENDRIVLNQPNIESMKPKTELVFMSEEYEDIEELTEEQLVDEDDEMNASKTEDLIIDGQVQFGDDDEKPSVVAANSSTESDEFAEIISPDQQIFESEFTNDTEFVDADGMKLVRIRIAGSDGKEQMAWVNVVSQEE
ncbi:Zinc finger protein [Pseudolycoriella hygida]|uniref:Zinc finger protein n=1 Tax=Pseudolycoriella hygida TaxID=35572 RepID=A0A9Q0S7Q2_9DIPT|nr:Zinc finger protein [Pseudolycoriella hygida]